MNKETVFNHTLHKKFWNYIADNGVTKEEALLSTDFDVTLKERNELIVSEGKCIACDYANKISIDYDDMYLPHSEYCKKYCPFELNEERLYSCLNGLYNDYRDALYYKKLIKDILILYTDPNMIDISDEEVCEIVQHALKIIKNELKEYKDFSMHDYDFKVIDLKEAAKEKVKKQIEDDPHNASEYFIKRAVHNIVYIEYISKLEEYSKKKAKAIAELKVKPNVICE